MPGSTPNGWQRARLGEVAEIGTGGTPPRERDEFWRGNVPWMASGEIHQRRVRATAECITALGLKNSNAKIYPVGTVMVAMNGQGRTRGMTALLEIEAACNQSLAAIRSDGRAEQRFLFHVLDQSYERLRDLTGDGRSGLNLELIRSYDLLLPPLPEQRAIAAVLDAADDTIERTEAVIAATEELRSALLHELLTRGVPGMHSEWKHVPSLGTVPACWDVTTLREVSTEIKYGTSSKLSTEGAWAVLRIPNVARGVIDLTDLKYADLSAHEERTLGLHPDDLLIVRTNGNPEICGASAVWSGREGLWAFASYLLRLRTERERLDSTYLWAYLRSAAGRRQLSGNIRTSAGNYNLSAEGLTTMIVPIPPIDEQREIANVVTTLALAQTERLDELDRARAFKSVLADALLSGHLRVGE